MKNTITLSQVSGKWMISIRLKTGTATLHTGYTTRTCAEAVQKAMQRLNPDCVVVVSNKIDKASFL